MFITSELKLFISWKWQTLYNHWTKNVTNADIYSHLQWRSMSPCWKMGIHHKIFHSYMREEHQDFFPDNICKQTRPKPLILAQKMCIWHYTYFNQNEAFGAKCRVFWAKIHVLTTEVGRTKIAPLEIKSINLSMSTKWLNISWQFLLEH